MNISEIKSTFQVRKFNESFIEYLVKEFKDKGFNTAYPVSITKDGVLWDGNHRYEAAKLAGLSDIPAVIETPNNLRYAAHERNRVAVNALPETFVDHAEEIWGMLAGGTTQTEIASELNITQPRVAQYGKLEILCPNAWGIITKFSESVIFDENSKVIKNITLVINERLLRELLDLTEQSQLTIITDLIDGKIKAGQVKNKAQEYRDREAFALYAIDNLIDKSVAGTFFNDCMSGLYSSQSQVEKAVNQANETFKEKNQIQVIHGDCFDELTKIKDQSADMLLTDPPYSILSEDWDTFKSKDEFIEFSEKWIALATAKIKPTGRIYIFWSQEFMFDFPFNSVNENFIFGNLLIWNYKNNVKPNNQHIYKHTYEPIFYFYGEKADVLNMPKNIEWNENHNSYDVFTIAQPQTNFKDKKEHPAQKPKELITQLISVGSEIGDTILDCFAGSGTTGLVAKETKRKSILIEKDSDYLKIINRRLSGI